MKRNQSVGFTKLELLLVLSIFLILFAVGNGFMDYLNGQRYKADRAAVGLIEAIEKARNNALLGRSDLGLRTVDLASFRLPQGVEFVTGGVDDALPFAAPILAPPTKIVFEAETARTENRTWGMIIVHDAIGKRTHGVLIPNFPGPLQRYVRYGAEAKFKLIVNAAL